MNNKINKLVEVIFFIIIFLFFFIFFYKSHPIMLLDTDDWYFSHFFRPAYPIIGYWNPARVLPEILMPLCLTSGLKFLSLFSNNYLNNISLINSFVVSIFILIYVLSFYKLIKNKFKLSLVYNVIITIIFVIFHFLIFRNNVVENIYMFKAYDACCYYYYVIPNLINCSLIMYYLNHNSFVFKDSVVKNGFMVLILYLAIFSNLFSTIILASVIGVSLLIKLFNSKIFVKKKFKKNNLLLFLKNNYYEISIIILWIIAHIFELTGGRATSLAANQKQGYFTNLGQVFSKMKVLFLSLNTFFIIISVLCIIVGCIIIIKNKLFKNNKFKIILISFILTTIYIILLCAKVNPFYIRKPEVIFEIVFYIFLFMCFVMAYILKKYKYTFIVFPLLIIVMIFDIPYIHRTFKDSNCINITSSQNRRINERIIKQIVDNQYKPGTVIYIPYFDKDNNNWPIPLKYAERIPKALYNHGVIKEDTVFKFEISKEYYQDILDY